MNRDKSIKFKVTVAEENELKKKAEEQDMTVSEYCRRILFDNQQSQKKFYDKTLPCMIKIGECTDAVLEHLKYKERASREDVDLICNYLNEIRKWEKKAWGI